MEAISAVKGILIKWTLVIIVFVIFTSNLLLSLFDSNQPANPTKRSNRFIATDFKLRPQPAQPISTGQTKLPPFTAELDKLPTEKPVDNIAGNTYDRGNCTWYAKSKRPDLPNSLGNADTWVSRAKALGYQTGIEPIVGAIGQQGRHVVVVESVNDDGTVTISEMNYQGLGVISRRTLPASDFRYIY